MVGSVKLLRSVLAQPVNDCGTSPCPPRGKGRTTNAKHSLNKTSAAVYIMLLMLNFYQDKLSQFAYDASPCDEGAVLSTCNWRI